MAELGCLASTPLRNHYEIHQWVRVHFFHNNALGVRGATERRRLEGGAEGTLLVLLIGPALIATVGAQLASGLQTTRLILAYIKTLWRLA